MAQRIKGITIEIGGDTTKLDKALTGTNKQVKTTQKELKAVEKALKLDPTNTELLAQKQQLLAESSEELHQKFDILSAAARNVDEALANQKDYDAQYEPLKSAIDETSQRLRELKAQQEDIEQGFAAGKLPTEQYNAYQTEVAETSDKLGELKHSMQDLQSGFAGKDMIDAAGARNLQRDLVEVTKATKDADDALKDFNSTSSKIKDAADSVGKGAEGLKKSIGGLSKGLGLFAGAAVGTVPLTDELRSDLSMLENNARQAGVGIDITTKAFHALYAVSGETDSSVEAVSNLLQAGVKENRLKEAVEGLANVATSFPDTIKIESLADSLQESVATGKATGQFEEALGRMGINVDSFNESLAMCVSENQRMELALNQLSSGPLAGAYQGWADNNEALIESRESALQMQEALADFAETIMPVITDITEFGSALIDMFTNLPEPIQRIAEVGVLFGAVVSPVLDMVSSVSSVVSDLADPTSTLRETISSVGTAAQGAQGAVASFLTGPAGIALGAAAAVISVALLYEHCEGFRDLLGDIDEWITGVLTTDWTESFGAMGEVLNGFFDGVKEVYDGIKRTLGGIVDFVNGVFSGDWERAWTGVLDIFGGLFDTLTGLITTPINGVIGGINTLLSGVANGLNALIDAINSISFTIPQWVPVVGGNSIGFNLSPVTAPSIPYLASGGLAKKNNPFLAVVGDNPTQDEIIAPEAAIKQWTVQGIQESGLLSMARSSGGGNATMTLDGRVFARLLYPYLQSEAIRRGVTIKT